MVTIQEDSQTVKPVELRDKTAKGSLAKDAIIESKPLPLSILEMVTQQALIDDILLKARRAIAEAREKALSPQLYFVCSNRLDPGAVNMPYAFTLEKPRLGLDFGDIAGPLEPAVACALAYMRQESIMLLQASRLEEPQKSFFGQLGIHSPRAFGQGISHATGNITSYVTDSRGRMDYDNMVARNIASLKTTIQRAQETYQENIQYLRSTGRDPKTSSYYGTWLAAQDDLKGYQTGLELYKSALTMFRSLLEIE